MALRINENCVGCGTCVDACPVAAIVQSGEMYKITDECTECGACVEVCPVEAIVD